MEKYKITVSGTEYNEEYFFEVPEEGKIEEEIAAIIEEVKAGGISKFTVEEVRDTCKKTIPCCGCADMEVCTKKEKLSRNRRPAVCRNCPTCTDETGQNERSKKHEITVKRNGMQN